MSFIYIPFSYLMKFCLLISGNYYIFALFFFALLIQVLLLYFSIKQQKSQIAMARVKPKEIAIREKYKGRNDKATQQKMNLEIQDMYRDNGYNQLSGCLPLLIQLPIIFILFTIVRNPIAYSSNLTNDNANFVSDNAQIAVQYYEDMKSALIKDSYEVESEYNDEITAINNLQTGLGGVDKDADGNTDGVYVYSKDSTYTDMYLSKLIIDGRNDAEKLISDGHLPTEFIAVYEDTGLEKNRNSLPKFEIAGQNLLNTPDFSTNIWLLIIPLLVFITSFFSTKITKKFSASAQQTDANGNPMGGGLFMDVGMPLISAVFAYTMPAAIGVYWIWRTVIGIGQTFILARVMPIPAVTEEQIAEAKRMLKGSTKKKKKVITIEVDEDDDSYSELEVRKSDSGANRTPRKIEMLTADDEPEEGKAGTDDGDSKDLPH